MKKLFSVILSLCLLLTIEYTSGIKASAESKASPVISIEISDYLSSGELVKRSGTGKYCAAIGDKIAVSFILEGVGSIDCYQLSGTFNSDRLLPGYFSKNVWITGDEEQDFNTIVAGSDEYTGGAFDDSFSYTRIAENPMICLIGFSLDGNVAVGQGITLVSVGFEVIEDIENIYDMFDWDNNTMVSASIDEEEYYLDSGLSFACCHTFGCRIIPPSCEIDGYTIYTCTKCAYSYTADYVIAKGHHEYLFDSINASEFCYTCSVCGASTEKTSDELKAIWSDEYINKSPKYTDDSCFLELHNDNIINAKDFAIINSIF